MALGTPTEASAVAERKTKKEPPLPPLRTFTYASSEIPGSYVRVHGREPKTKKDRDALIDIVLAARSMLNDRTDWRARAIAAEKKLEDVSLVLVECCVHPAGSDAEFDAFVKGREVLTVEEFERLQKKVEGAR